MGRVFKQDKGLGDKCRNLGLRIVEQAVRGEVILRVAKDNVAAALSTELFQPPIKWEIGTRSHQWLRLHQAVSIELDCLLPYGLLTQTRYRRVYE